MHDDKYQKVDQDPYHGFFPDKKLVSQKRLAAVLLGFVLYVCIFTFLAYSRISGFLYLAALTLFPMVFIMPIHGYISWIKGGSFMDWWEDDKQ